MDETFEQIKKEAIAKVSEELEADILFYNGILEKFIDYQLICDCIQREKKKNVLFMLVTSGGSADAAYRIAWCLQKNYAKFYFYVSGYCKSAGTLVAMGANEIIFSDHGEIGPLDVQLAKKDELLERQSGLAVSKALEAIEYRTLSTFNEFFINIEKFSGGTISVKTAADMAIKLTNGIYEPILRQIDPLHVGEVTREIKIAEKYAIKLAEKSQNFDKETINKLIIDYPSHGFVIDRNEAEKLFKNVREPNNNEFLLAQCFHHASRLPTIDMDKIQFLNDEVEQIEQENIESESEEYHDGKTNEISGNVITRNISSSKKSSKNRNNKKNETYRTQKSR